MALSDIFVGIGCGLSVLECDIRSIPDSVKGWENPFTFKKELSKDELVEKIIKKLSKLTAKVILKTDDTGMMTKKSARLLAEGALSIYEKELKKAKKKDLKKFLEEIEEIEDLDLSAKKLSKIFGDDVLDKDINDLLKSMKDYLKEQEKESSKKSEDDDQQDEEESEDQQEEETSEDDDQQDEEEPEDDNQQDEEESEDQQEEEKKTGRGRKRQQEEKKQRGRERKNSSK